MMMGASGGSLPYDAEVEYLESTGTQGINTNVLLTTTETYKINAGIVILAGSGASKYIFSATNSAIQVYTYNNNLLTQNVHMGLYLNTFAEIESITVGKKSTLKCFNNNISTTYGNIQGGESIWILKNAEIPTVSGGITRLYYCKIYENNSLVRDFIPVRKDGVGYMYDKVSKQLFGNVGTGSFILGADVLGGVNT